MDDKMLNEMKSRFAWKYVLYLPVLFVVLYLSGCSELETDIAQPQFKSTVHEEGILNSSSPNFHGNLIRENSWDMNQCQQCHGGNYNGGIVEVSCLTCHTQPAGPENCSTCHGSETSPAPPKDLDGKTNITDRGVGAHQVHLTGKVACADCHKVPAAYYDEGHIDSDRPAEVPIDGFLANLITNSPSTSTYNPGLPLFTPDPVYNAADQTCSNTYCHGAFKNGNTDNTPVWNDPSSVACGTCHGDPTASTLFEKALPGGEHISIPPGGTPCSQCHGGVVDENLNFINRSKHIDGKLNLFGSDVVY
jgi:predicted CxxxxCH...CXXCH cytochrome family protein